MRPKFAGLKRCLPLYWKIYLEETAKKLSESLEQVNTLKEQQDGDYYLTSLLVQPLSGNFIKLKETEFKIETLIRQKKQFHFKNKNSEIGGDNGKL